METEAKQYEIIYLVSPDISEDQVFGEAGKITGFIQESRGAIGRIEEPKPRRLAYPIRKHPQAYVGWTTFSVLPEEITAIKKRLSSEKSIIRFLIAEEVKSFPAGRRPYGFRPGSGPDVPRAPRVRLDDVKPFTPALPKEEDKTKLEELDKKLEEILGK